MKASRSVSLSALICTLILAAGCVVSQGRYDQLAQEHVTLKEERGDLKREHVVLQESHESLEQAHAVLQESFGSATREIEGLTQDNRALEGEVESLRDQAEALAQENQEMESRNATLSAAVDNLETRLQEIEGTLSNVRAENAALTSRVAELEDQLDAYYVTGFTCTRSMVPYIDCGDEAVWKGAFQPEDISVGTVISFRVPADCGLLTGDRIAHRVIEVKSGDGEALYLTQGDNSPRPDACWIPLSNINGVLALLRKGTRPEDVVDAGPYDTALERADALEAEYLAAEPQHEAARRDYEQALATYDARYDEYTAVFTQHCGFPPGSSRACSIQDPQYTQVNSLFNEVHRLYNTVETERQRVNQWASRLDDLVDRLEAAWEEVDRMRCEVLDICK